jgi:hypothetical protein
MGKSLKVELTKISSIGEAYIHVCGVVSASSEALIMNKGTNKATAQELAYVDTKNGQSEDIDK